jgi:hypothetical protein
MKDAEPWTISYYKALFHYITGAWGWAKFPLLAPIVHPPVNQFDTPPPRQGQVSDRASCGTYINIPCKCLPEDSVYLQYNVVLYIQKFVLENARNDAS